MSKGPALLVLSRAGAEAYEPDGTRKVVCISVTDPRTPPARLSPKFAAVLRLSFHDLKEAVPEGTLCDDSVPVVMMGPADAGEVVRFAAEHHDASVMVVHCEAGVSRSRSIAEALFDIFDRRAPNEWVYNEIIKAFRRNWKLLPVQWIRFRWLSPRGGVSSKEPVTIGTAYPESPVLSVGNPKMNQEKV